MTEKYSISLGALIKEFALKTVFLPAAEDTIKIISNEVDRPGLALAGFFEKFEHSRVQLIGIAEYRACI